LAHNLQRDALNLLYGNNSGSLIVTLSICLALVFGFSGNPDIPIKIYWLLFMCVLFTWRFFDMRYWQNNLNGLEYNATEPMLRFSISRYITAFAFSAYSIIFFDSMDVTELACTIVIMSSMAGGAATILAANKWLVLSYPFILLTPISVLCLFSSEDYKNIFGILGLIFVGVMFTSAKRSYKFTTESILIKNQHADLLDQMELKNQEVLQVNASLEEKVKKRTEQLFELSNVDPLTKLFNRIAFSENLKLLMDSSKRFDKKLAVLFIDLDGFKSINDSHGHTIGDKVLVETARRLRSQAEQQECLCRWGGDEFLISLPESNVDEAHHFAKTLIILFLNLLK
jgi:GGDEF domain-containing protein